MLKTIDLWPDDIAIKRVRAPITILREQAALLGQKTRNLIQGDVSGNDRSNINENFVYKFYIEAPTLDNYSYKLLSVYHRIDLYPLEINVEESILQEVSPELNIIYDESGEPTIAVNNEAEFVEALRVIFRAPKTVRVITALLSQVDPEWNHFEEEDNKDIPF